MSLGPTEHDAVAAPRPDWPADAATAVEELGAAVVELRERVAQLQQALESRVVIEQAKGVLAERVEVSPDVAFGMLRRAARSRQMRLHDLARQVVQTSTTPPSVAREVARLRREEELQWQP